VSQECKGGELHHSKTKSFQEAKEKLKNNGRKALKWRRKSWHQIQVQICKVVWNCKQICTQAY